MSFNLGYGSSAFKIHLLGIPATGGWDCTVEFTGCNCIKTVEDNNRNLIERKLFYKVHSQRCSSSYRQLNCFAYQQSIQTPFLRPYIDHFRSGTYIHPICFTHNFRLLLRPLIFPSMHFPGISINRRITINGSPKFS